MRGQDIGGDAFGGFGELAVEVLARKEIADHQQRPFVREDIQRVGQGANRTPKLRLRLADGGLAHGQLISLHKLTCHLQLTFNVQMTAVALSAAFSGGANKASGARYRDSLTPPSGIGCADCLPPIDRQSYKAYKRLEGTLGSPLNRSNWS
jgi:hypothetical protein